MIEPERERAFMCVCERERERERAREEGSVEKSPLHHLSNHFTYSGKYIGGRWEGEGGGWEVVSISTRSKGN